MKLQILIASLLAGLILPASAFARARESSFRHPLGGGKFQVPEGWVGKTEVFGIPFAIIGPRREASRPTIYVIPLGPNPTTVLDGPVPSRLELARMVSQSGMKLVDSVPARQVKWRNAAAEERALTVTDGRGQREQLTHIVRCGSNVYLFISQMAEANRAWAERPMKTIREDFQCKL